MIKKKLNGFSFLFPVRIETGERQVFMRLSSDPIVHGKVFTFWEGK